MRETKDTALLVVLFEDLAALLGLLIAAAALLLSRITGDPRWDGAASMTIAVLLVLVAFVIAFETKGLLVGESATWRDRAAMRAAILAVAEVRRGGRILTMHLGAEAILVNAEIELHSSAVCADVDIVVDEIESAIREVVPESESIFVEIETDRAGDQEG